MPWVRLHDNALTHPKMTGLVSLSNPFTLWVWGLSYCQIHLTDGLIPKDALPKTCKRAIASLLERRLWEPHDVGWKVHDYLEWNDSRELIMKKRGEAKARMATSRSHAVRANFAPRTSHEVLRGVGESSLETSEKGSGEKPSVEDRAARLREQLYPTWYAKFRHGARLRIVANTLEYHDAITICRTWDDARIEKLATLVLTTDDEWIANTDRGFRVFATKASWADERLATWEKTHGVKVTA